MNRKPVIIAILTLLGISSYFIWGYSAVREGLDPENDFTNWQPTAEQIRREMPAGTQAERQKAFRELFQKRFRSHEPGKAVGVHFDIPGKISLLTPARLEPWNIDRIALMLYKEARQNFNANYDIDIFETYIGVPPIKIGELRVSTQKAGLVNVIYHYPVGKMEPQPPRLELYGPAGGSVRSRTLRFRKSKSRL
jgi:hypothetical protein